MTQKLHISLALPSVVSYEIKSQLVKNAAAIGAGIYCSDLPSNHDLFQLLSVWGTKYPNIQPLGTAIISPFSYNPSYLQKQAKTIFELLQSRIELGFGVGDPALVPGPKSQRFTNFSNLILEFLSDPLIQKYQRNISLAGAGSKLLQFASDNRLGIIFNGIPDKNLVKSFEQSNSFSSYVMAETHSYNNLSPFFVKIVARILSTLPKSERTRLDISTEEIKQIHGGLKKQNYSSYQKWLEERLIKKVAFIGESKEIFEEFCNTLAQHQIKHVIFSFSSNSSRENWFSWFN